MRLEIGFVAPRPPRGLPAPPTHQYPPRGGRVEGNRVQRGVGSPRCAAAAARPERGGLGGVTPPGGRQAGAAGALYGPRRHLRGSGELRGRSGGVFRRPQEPHCAVTTPY
jgi:hypothetical protein